MDIMCASHSKYLNTCVFVRACMCVCLHFSVGCEPLIARDSSVCILYIMKCPLDYVIFAHVI